MKRYLYGLLLTSCILSCTSKSTFQSFYNSEKKNTDFALAFPKYMAMIAIPKESKEEVKYFTKGMRKIRVLYNEHSEERLRYSFQEFAREQAYVPYVVVKQDGAEINLFTREEEEFIREIILDFQSEDQTVIVALMGKMDKSTFQEAMKEATEESK